MKSLFLTVTAALESRAMRKATGITLIFLGAIWLAIYGIVSPSCGRSNRIPAQHLSDVGKCGACKAELPANEEQFNEIIRESKVPVLTDFWASWCGPCRMAAPHVAQTARELAGRAVVVKVDTERFPSLAAQYNVRSIPNFAGFSRGQLQFQQAGLVDAATMESWLTRAA